VLLCHLVGVMHETPAERARGGRPRGVAEQGVSGGSGLPGVVAVEGVGRGRRPRPVAVVLRRYNHQGHGGDRVGQREGQQHGQVPGL